VSVRALKTGDLTPVSLFEHMKGCEQWPEAYHPDIRLIVLRPVSEDDETETTRVVGFLRLGYEKLVNHHGDSLGQEPRPGDYFDSWDSWQRLYVGGATIVSANGISQQPIGETEKSAKNKTKEERCG